MTPSSGNVEEDKRRSHLAGLLAPDFEVFEEVWVRHALFRHRVLRADIIAIPKDGRFSHCAIGFEVKGYDEWDIPSLAKSLKQASDYVLATVEPNQAAEVHCGKRVMATFIYPAPEAESIFQMTDPKQAFWAGMIQSAGAHRVGAANVANTYKEKPLVLAVSRSEIWLSSRGWRADALNLLSGKRQIGSQKFDILTELAKMESK